MQLVAKVLETKESYIYWFRRSEHYKTKQNKQTNKQTNKQVPSLIVGFEEGKKGSFDLFIIEFYVAHY